MTRYKAHARAIKHFGDVRSMLQAAPNPKTWEILCDALGNWPDALELSQTVLPYVLHHLERWPDLLRVAPERWVDGMTRGAWIDAFSVVKTLDLQHRGFQDTDVLTLVRAPAFSHITCLNLSKNYLSALGIEYIVDSPGAKTLRHLILDETYIRDAGVVLIAQSKYLAALEILSISQTNCATTGVGALAQSPYLKSLHNLCMRLNDFDHNCIQALTSAPLYGQLESLDLAQNPIGMRGLMALVRLGRPDSLTHLNLTQARLHDVCAQMFVRNIKTTKLQTLLMAQNPLDESGLLALANTQNLKNLRHLDIQSTNATTQNAQAFAQSSFFPELIQLNMSIHEIKKEGVFALAHAQMDRPEVPTFYQNILNTEF